MRFSIFGRDPAVPGDDPDPSRESRCRMAGAHRRGSEFLVACAIGLLALMNTGGMVSAQDAATEEAAGSELKEPPLDPGQGDLDEAVLKRIDANTGKKLEAVASLLESALAKGLDEENTQFAKQMLASVQLQMGQGLFGAMMQGVANPQAFRAKAVEYLNKAVENDDDLVEAHIAIAQINALPGGDRERGLKSASRAIELLEDDNKKRSAVLVLRARFVESNEDKMKDLNEALEADPDNQQAFETRIALRLDQGEIDLAIQEVEELLEEDRLNLVVLAAAVDELSNADRNDEAIKLLTKALDSQVSDELRERLYLIRSGVYRRQRDDEKAMADMDQAMLLRPNDPMKLLQRAQLKIGQQDVAGAKSDLKKATDLEPRMEMLPDTHTVRYLIAMSEQRVLDAINHVRKVIELDQQSESRPFFEAELGRLYLLDDRPRQAIEVFDKYLENQPEDVSVLRSRGDALLAVGDHTQAIQDYEDAIRQFESEQGASEDLSSTDEQAEELRGLLNNLAWVLATSPQDAVRDPLRSLELGKEAARLSNFEAPHILSTLAAAYAENGDFEKAIEYSQVAVELGTLEENQQLPQLQMELESYRKGEAWREKQETEENDTPILRPEDLIDI